MATDKTIRVEIVSSEKELFSGDVQMVFAPAVGGEVGIAPGHAAFLSTLTPGEVRIKWSEDKQEAFYISGGILEVQPNLVTVLSDSASRAEDLNAAKIEQAKAEAAKTLQDRKTGIDYGKAQAQLAEAAAQLQTIQRLRKRAGR
ncbi:MAG: F0F1 ATP synthase subunit epsilon [Candidatus Porifericomitaceae bacterium WSBS_2022_MAG_OTU9]